MAREETKKFIQDMKAFFNEITQDKQKSLDFLIKAGICTPNGELTEEYK